MFYAICQYISASKPSIRNAKGSSYKMLSWVFLLVSIVIVVQSLALAYVSRRNQQHPALSIHIEPHALHVLLLPPITDQKPTAMLHQYRTT